MVDEILLYSYSQNVFVNMQIMALRVALLFSYQPACSSTRSFYERHLSTDADTESDMLLSMHKK
jgi:hypothetical protein